MRQLYRLLIFLFCFAGNWMRAQELCVLENANELSSLGRKFVFYLDDKSELSVAQAAASDKFKAVDSDIPNFFITSATVWARGRITCTTKADWYFSLDPAQFKRFFVYMRHGGGDWQRTECGNLLRPSERKPKTNHFIFPLNLSPGDTVDVMLSVTEYVPAQFNLRAGTLEAYLEDFHTADLYNAICYGLMLMMMIYNLYLFFSQQKAVYMYYVLYVAASLTFSAHMNGHVMYWPQWLKYFAMEQVPVLIPLSFGLFGIFFTLSLFGDALSRGIRLSLRIFVMIAVGELILSASPAKHAAEIILQIMGIVLCVLCISSGFSALRANHVSAKYYLLGFGAYMLSLVYLILSAQNIVPNTTAVAHVIITGSAIESIMLSFAAGDKLRIFEKEKEKAQEEALHQAQENARIIQEQNIMLEEKVKERTAELAEKNKEILDSITYASRIQRSLLPNEKYIERILGNRRKSSN